MSENRFSSAELFVGEVLATQVPIDAGSCQDLLGAGTADAEDIGQRNFHALVARKVHAY